jgi:ribosomal protein S18 acetylase RimI-like enzyme
MSAATTHHELILRDELVPADRAEIERIVRESKFFREDEIPVALELVDDRLAKGAKSDYKFIVAVRDGKVVGYCCYGLIPVSVHSYDVYWIAVDPSVQRSGIGKKLMAAAEDRVRATGGRRVYVETSSKGQYESTRRFYFSCAYVVAAVLEDFYAPADGKVVFVKVL